MTLKLNDGYEFKNGILFLGQDRIIAIVNEPTVHLYANGAPGVSVQIPQGMTWEEATHAMCVECGWQSPWEEA
jgi:hypothetical protein